ncbi:hypothetical protein DMC01_01490 [Campylobacter troglodytis]|nr:hypothetical protein DMC01_01490 [Campylobacter troglodytis]
MASLNLANLYYTVLKTRKNLCDQPYIHIYYAFFTPSTHSYELSIAKNNPHQLQAKHSFDKETFAVFLDY